MSIKQDVLAEIAKITPEIQALGCYVIDGIDHSGLSASAYITVRRSDFKSMRLTKTMRRAYHSNFPQANGGFDYTFTIRVSDHAAVSCRVAPNAEIKIGSEKNTVIDQLKFLAKCVTI